MRWQVCIGMLLVVSTARAQPLATGTTFPSTVDGFKAKATGESVLATEFNRLLSAVNALETRSLATPPVMSACINISITASDRNCAQTVSWPSPILGDYVVVTDVVDAGSPPRLVADGVASKNASSVTVCVWNRDAGASHTGTLCALAR